MLAVVRVASGHDSLRHSIAVGRSTSGAERVVVEAVQACREAAMMFPFPPDAVTAVFAGTVGTSANSG
ncbi:hypothetical protein AZ78_0984 [Lysobacter capsici AZ78]|uniref:Uncharacterized protein n=1 Tax=Lysobacter capsici AZ78 TaxID=1444315 RepID=A0A108U6G7_9GAMM|nr:hypothetical protein AZ78_0984 [Lysobacter capsici AZ78]